MRLISSFSDCKTFCTRGQSTPFGNCSERLLAYLCSPECIETQNCFQHLAIDHFKMIYGDLNPESTKNKTKQKKTSLKNEYVLIFHHNPLHDLPQLLAVEQFSVSVPNKTVQFVFQEDPVRVLCTFFFFRLPFTRCSEDTSSHLFLLSRLLKKRKNGKKKSGQSLNVVHQFMPWLAKCLLLSFLFKFFIVQWTVESSIFFRVAQREKMLDLKQG